MQDRGVVDKVITSTFHAWCFRMLHEYGLPAPNRKDFDDAGAWYAANVFIPVKSATCSDGKPARHSSCQLLLGFSSCRDIIRTLP